jgi:midasin (ATPase involved in ribosome maturation)
VAESSTYLSLFQLGPTPSIADNFTFLAPTTSLNVSRVMRGLQLTKPILLEGSPGVGKTSLVAALAKAAGYQLTRINVSDQTVSVSVRQPSHNWMTCVSTFECCINQMSHISQWEE